MDQAQGDLAHAQNDLLSGFFDWACFSSQQAAEKAMKAALQSIGADVWGHSVADLASALSEARTVPPEIENAGLELDKAYIASGIQTRTPRELPVDATLVPEPNAWWRMSSSSYGSAKVFYPRWSRAELAELLRSRLAALQHQLPLHEVVLFGSWATGRATAFSDVDLLVVYGGEPRDDAYSVVRRVLNVRGLEPHVYTEDEARRLAPTLERMTRDGIDLLGGPATPLG